MYFEGRISCLLWINFKSGQGDEAADSTDSTEPIHLVLQHLRESFSLSSGEATPYWFKVNPLYNPHDEHRAIKSKGRLKLGLPGFQTTLYIALHQGRIFLILVKPLNSSQ